MKKAKQASSALMLELSNRTIQAKDKESEEHNPKLVAKEKAERADTNHWLLANYSAPVSRRNYVQCRI